MSYAYLALSLVGVVLVANAIHPPRWTPVCVPSFFGGWLTGELAWQNIVVAMVCSVVFGLFGAFDRWPGRVGLAVALVDVVGLAWLGREGQRSGLVVADALQHATGGPIPSVPDPPAPQRSRRWRIALVIPFKSRSIERIKGIDYWGDGIFRHRLDIVRPRRRAGAGGAAPLSGAPVLVQIHGGAWVIGEKREQGIPLMHELAARGWVCVAINYRLSPKATWPDHLVDCKRAVAWVREHIAEYGGDPSFLAVTGGSAGGHLATMMALTHGDPVWQPGFEEADTSVDACVSYYGVYDLTGRGGSPGSYDAGLLKILERAVMKTSFPEHPEVFEEASPRSHIHPDAPPFLMFHGSNDTLVPVETARAFAGALRATSQSPVAFAELPRAQHAFEIFLSPRAWAATAGAVAFLDATRQYRSGRLPGAAPPSAKSDVASDGSVSPARRVASGVPDEPAGPSEALGSTVSGGQ